MLISYFPPSLFYRWKKSRSFTDRVGILYIGGLIKVAEMRDYLSLQVAPFSISERGIERRVYLGCKGWEKKRKRRSSRYPHEALKNSYDELFPPKKLSSYMFSAPSLDLTLSGCYSSPKAVITSAPTLHQCIRVGNSSLAYPLMWHSQTHTAGVRNC